MTDTLAIQYQITLSDSRSRSNMFGGQPSVAIDDSAYNIMTLSTGESHTLNCDNVVVMELEQPLCVTLAIVGNDGNTISVTKDMAGLVCLPAKTTITVSNLARFAYSSAIGVRVVTG